MILTIIRETLSPATLGRLSIDGVPECDTLERPWRYNIHMLSCIPEGRFRIVDRWSLKFDRKMLHVEGVEGREGILIHAANHVHELLGCIALGKRMAPDGLMESKPAVEAVEAKVRAALSRGEAVWIEVKNPVPVVTLPGAPRQEGEA